MYVHVKFPQLSPSLGISEQDVKLLNFDEKFDFVLPSTIRGTDM